MTDYQKLSEYRNLEQTGRLVRLPVKIDGYLYRVEPKGLALYAPLCVAEYHVQKINLSSMCVGFVCLDECCREETFWSVGEYSIIKLPKDVFLTREEAEAELKRRQGT